MTTYISTKLMSKVRLLMLLVLLVILPNPHHAEAKRTVKAGIYNWNPMVYTDADGTARGFYVEILNHLAQKEGWEVQYVPGTWQEGLDRLENDQIDLLVCVAYTDVRDKYMDFPKEYLLLDWGLVYKAKGTTINSIMDLEGKAVAVLKGDVYTAGFQELIRQFHITVNIVEVNQVSEIFKAFATGRVEAGVAANITGILNENAHNVERTPIIFTPVKIGYGVNQDRNGDLVAALDRELAALKADKSSVYYQQLEHLMGSKVHVIPKKAYWVLSGVVTALLLAIAWNILLKQQVKAKTEHLETEIDGHKKAEAEKAHLENRLNQSQKMEAIGQLAGGVAHDFNNKLMVILGNAELAKIDIHDSEKTLNYLDEIRRAAEYSRDITYRLLAFSRQQVITPQVLDANKVLAESLKSLSRLIGEHISISFNPDDKLWNIRMDPAQLDQVVMNLAINARDAMPDGGSFVIETRNITLNTTSCSAITDAVPGEYAMVTFSDTGTGMNKEMLTRIFEPFFTTKEVGKGTGLGLATIHGIISQNSGFIDVTSNVGYGTEFKVYLPRFSTSTTEDSKIADTTPASSCSILLVEDDDAVRSVTSQFLTKTGCTVHEAATPNVALELARDLSIPIDLVLTDFIMPEMNGRVMMERMLELRPQIRCIYASGHSTEHLLLSEKEHFIQKPYNFIKLSGFLKQVISEREK